MSLGGCIEGCPRVDIDGGNFEDLELLDTANGPVQVHQARQLVALLGLEGAQIVEVEGRG